MAEPPDPREPREHRVKRLRMRAWRRGIREMDLIMGGYADTRLAALDEDGLALFEAALGEADYDLYDWICGRRAPPGRYAPLVAELAAIPSGSR